MDPNTNFNLYPQFNYQNPQMNQVSPYNQQAILMSLLFEARNNEWVCIEHLADTNKKTIEQLIKITRDVVSKEDDLAKICRGIRDLMKSSTKKSVWGITIGIDGLVDARGTVHNNNYIVIKSAKVVVVAQQTDIVD